MMMYIITKRDSDRTTVRHRKWCLCFRNKLRFPERFT